MAKNVITVGAVDDIENGYQNTTDVKQINTDFSSWGPTDDGRIKPDIVANGDALYSTVYRTDSDSGSYFEIMDGTSMAAPNVTGSIALLQEHYQNTHNQNPPRAATIKGVIIHTADEAGSNPGPDYKFGWGLLNTAKAAEKISEDVNSSNTIQELTLSNNQTYSTDIFNDGTTPLKVTIVWTDPAPSNLMLSKSLVNDLDLRVSNGNNFEPWILNDAQPNQAASRGDNTKDNVEQVYISAPGSGYYTVTVTHKGTLSSPQAFSMIISGDVSPEATINISQVDINESSFGQAAYWNSSSWEYVNPTQPVTLDIEDQYFLASHNYKPGTTQKYHFWENNRNINDYSNFTQMAITSEINTVTAKFNSSYNATVQNALEGFTSASGGTIMFSDPWLVDATDPQKGSYSQGIGAPLKSVSSPLNLTTGSSYKGVLLNQDLSFDPEIPNYSVKTTSPQNVYVTQTGKTHKFYFQNWEGTDVNFEDSDELETAVVFTSANAVASANMKGTQLSNNSSTHANNSQRKLVSTINGDLHSVYESMGRIWLERSTDNGQTWTIMNNGRSLNDEDEAKNPSMAIVGDNRFVVVYQENIGGYNTITMKVVALEPTVTVSNLIEVYSDENLYNYDANPVVTVEHCSSNQYYYYLIVWDENTGIYQPKGLYYKIMQEDLNSVFTEINEDPTIITNTDNNSLNPTVTSSFISKSNPEFHVAWEQQSTKIK